MEAPNETSIVPFLKWAGGKRWLIFEDDGLFPSEYSVYFEPFLGSGAVFFHLKPDISVLSDTNAGLINAYSQLKTNPRKVELALKKHHRSHSESYYYCERERRHRAAHEQAAQFIYLNRTCWNGLYRVNREGRFNVPIGTKTSVILPTDDFDSISATLRNAGLLTSDFASVIAMASRGDFVFVDPPYVTRHNFNGFLKYNDKIFSWDDQVRLKEVLAGAAKRGVKILMTNADHASIRDLYHDLGEIIQLSRPSVIGGGAAYRNETTEVAIIINYEPE